MTDFNKTRVVVLAGGSSLERDVSLAGGRAVFGALQCRGFEVAWLDPAETDVSAFSWQAGDVAFLVLHGEFGEDGQVQEILDSLGVAYTGSDAKSSKLAFSKSATKQRLEIANIPTPPAVMIHRSVSEGTLLQRARALGYPLVVKPDQQGSSLGVSVVFEESQLSAAVARCFELGDFGLLESYVPGSEWTVGLWNAQPLPPICIETPRGFYDYAAKYADEETGYHFETRIPETVLERLKQIAVDVQRAIGTSGIARVDFRLDADQNPWVLEVNTIPGMTDHSLIPKAAARQGMTFPELCENIAQETARKNRIARAA